jgi:predicted nucleotidyltransferase
VIAAPAQFDNGQPFVPQVEGLLAGVPLTAEEWQTAALVVVPPALNFITAVLLAELHGRMGYFPAIVRLRPVPESVPPRFEVAEVINLQAVREAAACSGADRGLQGIMSDPLNEALRHLAERYTAAACAVLADNLTSVILYGSVARGQAKPGSDIDLLVICRELPPGAFRRQEVLEPVRERLQSALDSLGEQGCYADFTEVIRTEAEAQRTHPLYLDMTDEAVILYDRGGFFAQVLAQVRERLRVLGAQRKRLGRLRYWDLKPDFKPGEVITL